MKPVECRNCGEEVMPIGTSCPMCCVDVRINTDNFFRDRNVTTKTTPDVNWFVYD